jgi:putative integral membrane protein (TIGR02587 family)
MAAGRRHSTTSIQEYSRGLLGGLIFSMPLLLTAEVWQAGFSASPGRLLAGLAGTFGLLLAYNAVAGIRHEHEPIEVLVESIEELGLGMIVSFLVLTMLARIQLDMPPAEIAGQIVVAALTVAIGVSIGTAQLGGGGDDREPAADDGPARRHDDVSIAVLSLCGAVVLAANVAPTEEVLLLGSTMTPAKLLAVVAASLALAAVTLFFSEFHGSRHLAAARALDTVLHACIVAYAMALLSSALLLWFFGRFDAVAMAVIVGQTVVLALPGTLGAAAGRLLLR